MLDSILLLILLSISDFWHIFVVHDDDDDDDLWLVLCSVLLLCAFIFVRVKLVSCTHIHTHTSVLRPASQAGPMHVILRVGAS